MGRDLPQRLLADNLAQARVGRHAPRSYNRAWQPPRSRFEEHEQATHRENLAQTVRQNIHASYAELSKGAFFINDQNICPPDVHHARGMHCIDCHNAADAMGDGNMYGEMEYAVGVSCSTCHGTYSAKAA